MGGRYVNLNEAGGLANAGQGYEGNAEDQYSESKNFGGKMEAAKHGLKGASGNTFYAVSDLSQANLAQLANRIANQAYRAVHADRHIQTGDQEADSAQHTTVAAHESLAPQVSRDINV
ncbi:MAG: hypothetical protein WCA46_27680 [Actinocatenispora sp.]